LRRRCWTRGAAHGVGVLSAAVEHDNQGTLPAICMAWDEDHVVPRTSLAGEGSREISCPIRHRYRRRLTGFHERRRVKTETRKVGLTQQLQDLSQWPFHARGGAAFSCSVPHVSTRNSSVLPGLFEPSRILSDIGLQLDQSRTCRRLVVRRKGVTASR
jgi:hypothetical protein